MARLLIRIFAFLLICSPLFADAAFGVEIKPVFEFARSGNKILGACRYEIPPEFHAYSNDPGPAGMPTVLNFTLEGEGAMPALYPKGKSEPDIYDPSKIISAYSGNVTLLVVLPAHASGGMYAANLNMLLCSSRRCQPDKQSFTGHVDKNPPMLDSVAWKAEAEKLLSSQGDSFGALSLEEGSAPPPIKEAEKPAQDEKSAASSEKETEIEDEKQITGEPKTDGAEHFDLNLAPRYADASLEIFTLGKALLLGLLAGMLLNAMPCVLPVLTLKVSGILMMGNLPDKQKIHQFRMHNLCFAAGILTFFAFLAFLLSAADLMWGQLYQNQALLLVMLLLVFLMGLSMLGVFTLPVIDLRLGQNTKNPKLQSYFTGMVSTFLATPCSGPLLGGALAWAFTQPMPVLLAVFISIGLGMALPYIAFCLWPGMARILPRPGDWMYVFEHILGFLLLGTSLYLLSIMPAEKHMEILAVLLLVALCAWLWGRFCGLGSPLARRRMVAALGILLLCASIWWVLKPAPPSPRWQPFTYQTFMENLGKKNMLVEFTADWCPNCKFLEATVLSPGNLTAWQKKYGLDLVRVDLTRSDPYAERLLEMLGSKSIPLTALFGKGMDSRYPLALRDIYTTKNLEKCMAETFGNS